MWLTAGAKQGGDAETLALFASGSSSWEEERKRGRLIVDLQRPVEGPLRFF